jgi:flagellin FlaB
MNTMRLRRKNRRAIVGIEAAIVMIAFVVIAAALAYVVINMGFYSAQTAKTTIDQGVTEATSALELDGFITARTDSTGNVTYLAIPVKLAVGHQQVDMSNNTVVVAVQGGNFSLANIYNGSQASTQQDLGQLMNTTYMDGYGNVSGTVSCGPNAECFIYDGAPGVDNVLEQNAKAYIIISLGNVTGYALPGYSSVKVEIRTSVGAALMVKREIPGGLSNNTLVDLG